MYIHIYIYIHIERERERERSTDRQLHAAALMQLPRYTRSPSHDFRLFGPRPWKILATTYEQKRFLSNPDPGENLVTGNLVMQTGCTI